MTVLDDFRRALRPLSVKVANLFGRGVIKRVDDSKKIQELQVDLLEGETRDEIQRFQQYGVTSHPVPGSDCLVFFVGGRRDQAYCVGVEEPGKRIGNLNEGETALYNGKTGATLVMKANGDIEATPKSGQKFRVVGATELSGDVTVTGTLTASVDVVGGGKHLATHTHSVTGSAPPGGGPVVFVPPALTGTPS